MVKKKQQNKSPERLRLENVMANCIGTEHYYTSPILVYRYTDGVKTFACEAGAYWFLSELNRFVWKVKDFEKFTLKVEYGMADIFLGDKKVRHIAFTDCPEGEWEFFYDRASNLLMWNMEY